MNQSVKTHKQRNEITFFCHCQMTHFSYVPMRCCVEHYCNRIVRYLEVFNKFRRLVHVQMPWTCQQYVESTNSQIVRETTFPSDNEHNSEVQIYSHVNICIRIYTCTLQGCWEEMELVEHRKV